MKAAFKRIAQLISTETDKEDEILLVHTFKKDGLSSAYSLLDANIYVRSWPKLNMANIKLVYSRNVHSMDILGLLCDIFQPGVFRIIHMPN